MSDVDLIASTDSPFPPWVRDAVRELRNVDTALRKFVVETQEELWGDLLLAVDRAINGVWSIECDGIAVRIRKAARLVGPTPWRDVDWGTYTSGLYRAVLYGIDFEEPTDDEIIATDRLMEPHRNPGRFHRLHAAAIHVTSSGVSDDE